MVRLLARFQIATVIVFFVLLYIVLNPGNNGPANNSCSCQRLLFRAFKRPELNGTCSDNYASDRTGQSVISFSYYEPPETQELRRQAQSGENFSHNPSVFQIGILENLRTMRQYYPGYVMRVYTDVPLEGEYCSMLCSNPDLHWCDIRQTPRYGNLSSMFFMSWRFIALGDPTVDIVLSRDLDSVITEREQGAVRDWLAETNKSISLMRDHLHHNIPILAGTWGPSNHRLTKNFGLAAVVKLQLEIIEESTKQNYKQWDQFVLKKVLFHEPYTKSMVAYDSYTCVGWRNYTLVRPFTIQRKNAETDFVGNQELGKQKYNLSECPVTCRPSYGQDWTYC